MKESERYTEQHSSEQDEDSTQPRPNEELIATWGSDRALHQDRVLLSPAGPDANLAAGGIRRSKKQQPVGPAISCTILQCICLLITYWREVSAPWLVPVAVLLSVVLTLPSLSFCLYLHWISNESSVRWSTLLSLRTSFSQSRWK